MKNVVVAGFENKRDADFIARMIKRYRKNARVFKGTHWEDLYLGEMIEEGMKEKGEISEKEFISFLDKKINGPVMHNIPRQKQSVNKSS